MVRKTNSKKLVLAVTLCVIGSGCILETASAAESQNKLDVYEGQEYVVTATKTKLEEKKVPIAAEVVTQEEIKRTGAYDVRDALRRAVGVDVQESGMTGNQVMIRGMDTTHTLILINGRRMAAENTGSTINAYELQRINLNDVERIEVIRGNGSALYGSDAMGGVINIITKKPTEAGGSFDVHTGSKHKGTSFSYSTGQIGKLSLKFGGGIEDIRQRNSSYYSASSNGTVHNTNMYGPRRYLNFGADYAFDENRGLEFDMNFMREQFQSNSSDPDSTGHYNYDNNRSDYSLNYYGKDNKHDYNLRVYYNTLKKDNDTKENNTVTDWDYSAYDTFVVEGKDSIKMDDKNTLTFGAEYTQTSMKGTRFGGGGDNKYTETKYDITKDGSEKEVNTYAGYIQDEWQLTDKLFLLPSVRFDHHDSFGSHTSPKIGATYELSDSARVKMNYGKGYRAPTVYELYAQMEKRMGGMTVVVYGNDELEPEESTNFDVSFEAEKGKLNSKFSYFHNKVDNLIVGETLGMSFGPGGRRVESKYFNVDEAEIQGTEAVLGYYFDDNWSAKVSYTYLDARDKSDNSRLTNRARHNGSIQLNYTDNAELPLTATLWNQYYVDYLYDDHNYTFSTTNFVVNKQLTDNLRVYAGVDNIFDKEFTVDDDHTYTIDGRMWRVGAEMTF